MDERTGLPEVSRWRIPGRPATGRTDGHLATDEVGLAGSTQLQTSSLEALVDAPNYQDWLSSLALPILGDDPIELGSGIGDYAAAWLAGGVPKLTLTEIAPARRAALETRFAGDPRVCVTSLDITNPTPASHSAMVSFNVLEHIRDDVAALACAHAVLRPGGRILHLVPAFPFALSRFDVEIGHFRRYTAAAMVAKAREAGLVDAHVRYLNAPGLLAWFVMMKLLRQRPSSGPLLRLWDGVVIPFERRIESRVAAPFGQSLVLTARTPPTG